MDSSHHENDNSEKLNDECSNDTTKTNSSSNNSSTKRFLNNSDTTSCIEIQLPNSNHTNTFSLQGFDFYVEDKEDRAASNNSLDTDDEKGDITTIVNQI